MDIHCVSEEEEGRRLGVLGALDYLYLLPDLPGTPLFREGRERELDK